MISYDLIIRSLYYYKDLVIRSLYDQRHFGLFKKIKILRCKIDIAFFD